MTKKKSTRTKKAVRPKAARKTAKKAAPKRAAKKSKTTKAVRTRAKKPVATRKKTSKARTVTKETAKRISVTEAQKLADRIAQLMLEKKAEDVVIADLDGLTSVTDCFVICSSTSDLHSRAIADHVIDQLTEENVRPHHREGQESNRWILIDYVDVVAHVFQKTAREFYNLERLWGDATFTPVRD